MVYFPSSPLKAIAARAPAATVRFADGSDRAAAVQLAAPSDVAIIFAHQWGAATLDPSLTLPDEQDQLIAAVGAATAHVIVVLETKGPVLMPWLERTAAVPQAWYPGTRGGEAIARVLFVEVTPSGRLPVTFPRDLSQLPRPALDGSGQTGGVPFPVLYSEGAAVGYKWYDKIGLTPLFPFGFGLTYTDFRFEHLTLSVDGDRVTADFDVSNTGSRAGKAVPQVYVGAPGGACESPRRLAAWSTLVPAPGATEHVRLAVPPRLWATFDAAQGWSIAAGEYQISLGSSSRDIRAVSALVLPATSLPLRWTANP
jgi:beta-glucosidase